MPVQSSPFSAALKSLGIDLSAVHTSAEHVLGSLALDQSGNTYMYVSADTEALTANGLVQIDGAGVAIKSDLAGDRIDGFAPVAIPLDNFGWVGIRGDFANVPATTGLLAGEYVQYFANSQRVVKVPAVNEAGSTAYVSAAQAARGLVLVAESSNFATVRFF